MEERKELEIMQERNELIEKIKELEEKEENLQRQLTEMVKELREKEEYLERKLTEMDEYIESLEESARYDYSDDEDSMSACCTRAIKLGLPNCPKCDDKYE
jgi:vacuolar-type H+-ATPase subunit D/Vma8